MFELYDYICSPFEMLMMESHGVLPVLLLLGLIITVTCGYRAVKSAKYNLIHATYFALIAYAVAWIPSAATGIYNYADGRSSLYLHFSQHTLSLVLACIYAVCEACALISPWVGLYVAWMIVRRTLGCTSHEAFHFMFNWSAANLVLGIILIWLVAPNCIAY
jgi:hypothetical protein